MHLYTPHQPRSPSLQLIHSMATLPDCPNETLSDIASCLSTHDLLSFSRVSRHFYSISLPFIYKTPMLFAGAWYQPPGLPRFMQTLLAKPALANHVRSLQAQLEYWPSAPPSPGNDKHMASAASLREYNARKQGLHLVQLLHMLPHLTHLDLWPPDEPESGSRMTNFLAALKNRTMLAVGLQNLREFRSVMNIGFTAEFLIAAMTLPSIRTIVVTVSINYSDDNEDEPLRIKKVGDTAIAAAGTSTLTDLQLLCTDLSTKLLASLLGVPRALTRFRHQSAFPQTHFDLAEFGRVLGSLAPLLEHLNIGFGETNQVYATGTDGWGGSIGALGDWHALETLECPMMALLGRTPLDELSLVGVLPRGLRSLHVTEDVFWSTRRSVEVIVRLLETGEMASLREICLLFMDGIRVPRTVLDRLGRACEEAHVAFVTQTGERNRRG